MRFYVIKRNTRVLRFESARQINSVIASLVEGKPDWLTDEPLVDGVPLGKMASPWFDDLIRRPHIFVAVTPKPPNVVGSRCAFVGRLTTLTSPSIQDGYDTMGGEVSQIKMPVGPELNEAFPIFELVQISRVG